MSERAELIWYGDDAPWYDHGPEHPLRPARVILTRELIKAYGLLDGRRVAEKVAQDATDQEIGLVHGERYIDATKRAGHDEPGPWWEFGYGPGDNPVFPNMHEAAARVAGASLVAAEAVLTGRAEHAFNPAGGLHHAMPERASGFCVYDDPAIAIAWMLANGAERIAYVDVDVHHGDGVHTISSKARSQALSPVYGGNGTLTRRARRSTSRCRRTRATTPGCAPSRRSCRRSSRRGSQPFWSPSSGAIRTTRTLWPCSASPRTPTGEPPASYTTWRTARQEGDG